MWVSPFVCGADCKENPAWTASGIALPPAHLFEQAP